MNLDFPLLLDVLIAVLLVVTIVYATILNRKLSALRESKAELQAHLKLFQSATDKTETTLAGLREAAERAGKPLQDLIDEAASKSGDLKFLLDRSSSTADRLEEAIGTTRARGSASHGRGVGAGAAGTRSAPGRQDSPTRRSGAASSAGPSPDESGSKSVSPEQADLIRALQGVR